MAREQTWTSLLHFDLKQEKKKRDKFAKGLKMKTHEKKHIGCDLASRSPNVGQRNVKNLPLVLCMLYMPPNA